jgi:hypothetical protein
MHTIPHAVLPSITLEEGYDKARIPRSRRFGLIRPASTQPRPGLYAHRRKGQHDTGLRVISPSCPRRHHGVQGWPATPEARRYSHLYRNRQNFTTSLQPPLQESTKLHLKAPGVLASSYPIKGQARALQKGKKKKKADQHNSEINISSDHPCTLFSLLETWARRPLSPACNPYASTSVQGNTKLSPRWT